MQAAPVPRRGVTAGVEPHVKETGAAGRGLALLGCQRARSAPRGACLGLLGPAGTPGEPCVGAVRGQGERGAPPLPPPAFLRRVAFCLLAASRLGHRRPLFRFPQNPTGDFRRDLRARCATARAGPSRSSRMVFWGRRVLAQARSRQAAVRCRFGAGGLSGQPRTGWAESRPRGCRRLRTGWAERAPGCGRGPRGPCTGGRRLRRTGSPAPGGEKSRLWLLGRPPRPAAALRGRGTRGREPPARPCEGHGGHACGLWGHVPASDRERHFGQRVEGWGATRGTGAVSALWQSDRMGRHLGARPSAPSAGVSRATLRPAPRGLC